MAQDTVFSLFQCAALLCVFITFNSVKCQEKATNTLLANTKRLYDDLRIGYNKYILPRTHENESVPVDLTISLLHAPEVDESAEQLSLDVWMNQRWLDTSLTWDPAHYGGITKMLLPSSVIWTPDTTISNGYVKIHSDGKAFVHVNSEGKAFLTTHLWCFSRCALDLTYYPYDEQKCTVSFLSWAYNGLEVNFTDVNTYFDGGKDIMAFEVTNWTGTQHIRYFYSLPSVPYPIIHATLTLKRRATFAAHLGVAPAAVMCLLIPVVFLLPPGTNSKTTLGVGILISDVLLLNLLVDEVMDFAHPTIPRIAVYYIATMVLVSLSLACSALVEIVWYRRIYPGTGVPNIVRKIVLDVFGKLLCVPKITIQNNYVELDKSAADVSGASTNSDQDQIIPTNHSGPSEWAQLAAILDRLLLIIFFVVVILTSISMILK